MMLLTSGPEMVHNNNKLLTPIPPEMDIMFQDGLPFEFTCPKCQQALRTPLKTPCGHHYCDACVDKQSPFVCLVCSNEVAIASMVVDKEKHRQIQTLAVLCTFHQNGCDWKGQLKQLQTHTESCDYGMITCDKCGLQIGKQSMGKHEISCKSMAERCEFCNGLVKKDALQRHLRNCKKVIVSCPFQCGLVDKTREEINLHRATCPKADESCPFAELTCEFKGDKQAVQQHLSLEPVRHLILLCDETLAIKEDNAFLHTELNNIFDRAKLLERRTFICEQMYGSQMVWKIDNFVTKYNEAKSGTKSTIFSPTFVSGRHGYKLVTSACLFGDGPSRGKYLSVYVALVKGEFDAILAWPFHKVIRLTLCSQAEEVEDRVDVEYCVDSRQILDSSHFLGRPIGDRNASFGAQAFISLEKLEEYVKDDCLFIKVDIDDPVEENGILNKANDNNTKELTFPPEVFMTTNVDETVF